MTLDDLLGKKVGFCGIDNYAFCVVVDIARAVFEAVEDEDDGYRSMMKEVKIVPEEAAASLIFFGNPVVDVTVRGHTGHAITGYELVDDTGHVWLEMGTDDSDDYYPSFVWTYTPNPAMALPVSP